VPPAVTPIRPGLDGWAAGAADRGAASGA
jgi:hypothetical protein